MPDATLAAELAKTSIGGRPSAVRRFSIGSSHYVFEVDYVDRPPVVVRIARSGEGVAMAGAAYLNKMLRPMGVPLPELLADGSDQPVPYLILQRLPGLDLGEVIETLSDAALEGIAAKVAAAQAITSKVPTAGRYGYSVRGRRAPYDAWSKVLMADLERSRHRITAAGLFDVAAVDAVSHLVATTQAEWIGCRRCRSSTTRRPRTSLYPRRAPSQGSSTSTICASEIHDTLRRSPWRQ